MVNRYKIIKDDVLYLYKNCHHIDRVIEFMKYPIIEEKIIGNSGFRFKIDNYCDIFCKEKNNGNYCIRLSDGSLINYIYYFDNKDLIGMKAEFIPCFESEMFKDKSISNVLSKYFRIDWEIEGYIPYIHPLVHFHNSYERDSLRISMEYEVLPSEFVYIILKYIYGKDSNCLKSHVDEVNKKYKKMKRDLEENLGSFILKVY